MKFLRVKDLARMRIEGHNGRYYAWAPEGLTDDLLVAQVHAVKYSYRYRPWPGFDPVVVLG